MSILLVPSVIIYHSFAIFDHQFGLTDSIKEHEIVIYSGKLALRVFF